MPRTLRILLGLSLLLLTASAAASPRLYVSDNRHYLVREGGQPFFWLGDTAWLLFQRLDRKESEGYLLDRARKGFTVIQAVVVADFENRDEKNAYGESALIERDPRRPNEAYFAHVDWVVRRANQLGMVVAMLPTWGQHWSPDPTDPPALLDVQSAADFGAFLGRRYRDADLVWVLGGDKGVQSEAQKPLLRALAGGLRQGDGGAHLITFHPKGASGSSQWLHDEPWLDFNMRQNGHDAEHLQYARTREDWDRQPHKPVLDAEPLYEDHPIAFDPFHYGHSCASDVRRPLYWDLFAGAFGHTYGNHAIWQFWQADQKPINDPLMPWHEALAQPGAAQMRYARRLLESRPFLDRVPDDSIIVPERVTTLVPGKGRYRFVGTRDEAGSYAMVYAPVSRPFTVRLDVLRAKRARAWWFDPRTGRAREIGSFPARGTRRFVPPQPGEAVDWVLVLDDESKRYPPPGAQR